ncbi:MAG: hypothetical protein ACLQVJ_17685 [Syntrophobacteraceae bacterium]
MGDSDCRAPEQAGRTCTVFGKPLRSMEELTGEIRNGNRRGEAGQYRSFAQGQGRSRPP